MTTAIALVLGFLLGVGYLWHRDRLSLAARLKGAEMERDAVYALLLAQQQRGDR